MAFNPRSEDYQRLSLRYTKTFPASEPFEAVRAHMNFARRYAERRDFLPQSDEDRAFHLMASAAELVDYRMPFSAEEETDDVMAEAQRLLDEAIDIDATCYDALRMRQTLRADSFEECYRYLSEHAAGVRTGCEQIRRDVAGIGRSAVDEVAATLAMYPYVRWMAALATRALMCGRYRRAIEVGEELLAFDTDDPSDVRFTLALAYAKLEDEAGFEALLRRAREARAHRSAPDPWELIARMAFAYKKRSHAQARELLEQLAQLSLHGPFILLQQLELPEGLYARLAVPAGSADELVLAISEASVLLQEGRDMHNEGTFGWWTMMQAAELAGFDADDLSFSFDDIDDLGDEPPADDGEAD